MKLLYNEEELKTELLNSKITLWLAIDMVDSRLISIGLISSGGVPVGIQLATYLFPSNISELSIGAKTTKFW